MKVSISFFSIWGDVMRMMHVVFKEFMKLFSDV